MRDLVEKLDGIIDGYYADSTDYAEVKTALKEYDRILDAVAKDSLARDGMEMIESVLRDMRSASDADNFNPLLNRML